MFEISLENLENFVFSNEKRDELLKNLIPGTDDYFYFNCLNDLSNNNEKGILKLKTEMNEKNKDYGKFIEVKVRILLEELKTSENTEKKIQILKKLNKFVFNLKFKSDQSFYLKSTAKENTRNDNRSEFNSKKLNFHSFLKSNFKNSENFKKITNSGLSRISILELIENANFEEICVYLNNCEDFSCIDNVQDIFKNKMKKIQKESQIFDNFRKFSLNQIQKILKLSFSNEKIIKYLIERLNFN